MDTTSVFYRRDGAIVHFAKAFTVVNSGTSPVALVRAYVSVGPTGAEAEPSCDVTASNILEFARFNVALVPTIVKAGEIGVVPLTEPNDLTVSVERFRKGNPFVLCLELHFIVPHHGPGEGLIRMPLMVLGEEQPIRRTSDYLAPQPKYLVRRNLFRTIATR